MRRPRWLAVTVAIVAVLPVVACGPDDPGGGGTTPVTSPSPADTDGSASASPSPSGTGPSEADFKAAEQAYRDFNAERNRLEHKGGANKATPTMTANAGGPFLDEMLGYLREQRRKGQTTIGDARIAYVRPSSKVRNGAPANELTLIVCEDGRSVITKDKNGRELFRGHAIKGNLYARLVSGRWKIWDADGQEVSKC